MKNSESLGTLSIIPKIGRPKKFQSVEELEERIQAYFNGCFMQKRETLQIKEYYDEDGEVSEEPTDDWKYKTVTRLVVNERGEPVYEMIRPFTITGLAVALDTTRDTLLDYENKPENAAFSDTIKKAKQVVQMFNEESLHRSTQVAGIIFSMKNNFGWVDKTETDITSKGKEISPAIINAKVDDILKIDNPLKTDDVLKND